MTIIGMSATTYKPLRVTTLGRVRGTLVKRHNTLDVNTTTIEWGFIAMTGDVPAQARIHHRVWSRALGRFDSHVELVDQVDLYRQLGREQVTADAEIYEIVEDSPDA